MLKFIYYTLEQKIYQNVLNIKISDFIQTERAQSEITSVQANPKIALLKVSPLPPMEYDGSMGCILTCHNGLPNEYTRSMDFHTVQKL